MKQPDKMKTPPLIGASTGCEAANHPLFRRPGRALADSSHLDRHDRGSYRFKITLPGTALTVGKRVTLPLLTRDPELAAYGARVLRAALNSLEILPFDSEIEAGDNYPYCNDKETSG